MGEPKKALVVEDDEGMITYIKRYLEMRKFTVFQVFYVSSEKIPPEEFDLAIVDGLEGDWKKVVEQINAKRIIVYSSREELKGPVESLGFEFQSKSETLKRVI